MPTISKIRFANVIYEQGLKRYHDETFQFDAQNGAILLENGGGKTVFIQAAMQAIIPHAPVANRQIKDTLYLEEGPAHIAIEWLLNERPRQYVVTAVTLYTKNNKIESLRYVYAYSERDPHCINQMPFTKREAGMQYPASKDEMQLYYQNVVQQTPMRAKLFPQSIKAFTDYLESNYFIIREEWDNMIVMNSAEGGIEKVFAECKGTQELFDRLLIPSVENADKHFNSLSITDQFEKQRSNLKKYKEFNEKKIEYSAMQEQMDHYVERYRLYDVALSSYEDKKQRTASYMHYLQQQKEETEQEVAAIGTRLTHLKEIEQQLLKRERALEIYKEQEKQQQLQAVLTKSLQLVENIDEQIKLAEHEKTSLQYAMDVEKLKQTEEIIAQSQQMLQKESEKEDLGDLQNELELLKGQWLYLLEDKREQLEKQLQQKQREAQQLKEQEQQVANQVEAVHQKIQEARSRVTRNETLIEEKSKHLERLKSELVANENEQVEDLLKIWHARGLQLERSSREHEDQIKRLQQQSSELLQTKNVLTDNSVELKIQVSKLEQGLEQQALSEAEVKEALRTVLHQMSTTATIYDRAASYTNQLQEKRTQLEAERADKFVLERKAYRYLDDYDTQSQFFADAYVADQIQHWSQFTHIQTGVEYVQTLEEEADLQHAAYPFWAITLITTASEKQALIDKVHVIADKLTTPIIVLTREEARQLLQGESFDESWVAPLFWRDHVAQDKFLQWKRNAMQEANQIKEEREKIEAKLNTVNQVVTMLSIFLEKYPYAHFKQLTGQHFEATQSYKRTIYDLKQLEQKEEEIESLTKQVTNLLQQEKDELQHLNFDRIPKAQDYMRMSKQLKPLEEQCQMDKAEVRNLERKRIQLEQEVKDLQQQWLEGENEAREFASTIDRDIINHDIYLEKASLTARPTTLSEHALKLEVKRINNALNQVSATIQHLTERIATQEGLRAQYKKALEQKLEEYPNLDPNIELPLQPEQRIKHLQAELKRLQDERQYPQREAKQQEKALQELIGKIKTLVEQYGTELPQRTTSLPELEQTTHLERIQFEEQQTFFKGEQERMSKQAENLASAEMQSREAYFQHQLNQVKDLQPLSSEQQTAFLYDYEKELKYLFAKLTEHLQEKQRQQQMIDKEKQQFRNFCAKLQDQKLSKVTMDGIENRHSFKEIAEHQQLIRQTIQQAIHLADAAIQEYDKDQQQIIQYAVQQLVRVRHNLLEIPKKTRVRTEEGTKYIFQFNIPDWEEHEAKEAIREYINWILTILEQDKYRDEYGNEDVAVIRKFLEKYLQTVPLLRQVLGNKKMQVKCRKVESERQISENFYSWEQSNQWSGGESWSKNMALYLGILKFISEKSGGPTNTKRDRVLILDNPFGKASSDHVLSPVFYIAEQLGFQMIALTAHAEGKYIADYFPVVYSCRLRSVRNAAHQVIQKEQKLNKAFFADKQPEALHYVGEKKQLSLFEQ